LEAEQRERAGDESGSLSGGWQVAVRWLLRFGVLAGFLVAVFVFYQLLSQAGVIGDRVAVDQSRFEDVPLDSPFRPAVEEVAQRGIMEGISAELFAPQAAVTRGQFATILVKAMEWQVTPDESSPFGDVENQPVLDTGDYIAVVNQRSIMTGNPGEPPTFSPESEVSLEQAVVAVVRAGGDELEQPITREASIDARSYNQSLKDALQVAVRNGLLTGTGIDPEVGQFHNPAQRQQLAALLVNLRQALRF
jgi:hypothetical protein